MISGSIRSLESGYGARDTIGGPEDVRSDLGGLDTDAVLKAIRDENERD